MRSQLRDLLTNYFLEIRTAFAAGWDRFWFTPIDPASLGIIRIFTGCLLCYSHFVWGIAFGEFFGEQSWINRDAALGLHPANVLSYLWVSMGTSFLIHVLAGLVLVSFTVGFATRWTSIASYLITVSYAHRNPLALFGFDQVVGMLTLYLAVGPAGGAFSLDRWFKSVRRGREIPIRLSISANLAQRLMQLHLCLIYLFAGLSKLQGEAWWDGSALWLAAANREYQTIDLTIFAQHQWLFQLFTHFTLAWEVAYCVLVWNRLLRPMVLLFALPLHLGIGLCFGMTTFGLAMLVANLSFISPELIRKLVPSPPVFERETSFEPLRGPKWQKQALRGKTRSIFRAD